MNPLLKRTSSIPFDLIKPEHICPAIEELRTAAMRELETIKNTTEERSFDNTMLALDKLALGLDWAFVLISHLESVATTPEWRKEFNTVLPTVTEFHASLPLDGGLWSALQACASAPEVNSLAPHRARFLSKTVDSFKREGAGLEPTQKQHLASIQTELAKLANSFSQNTLDATNAFEFITTDKTQLAGLPESALALGRTLAQAKGLEGWRFTLQIPSVLAILTYAEDRSLRERFYRAHNTRCAQGSFDNRSILYRILELRREKAQLLGYNDFADLVLADRMALDGAGAANFLEELRSNVGPFVQADSQQLKDFVEGNYSLDYTSLKPWDLDYYCEKMRKELFDLDKEALRPYFALPRVLEGLWTIVEQTFGISVKPNDSLPKWDPRVETYTAYDSSSGRVLGHFYADLFPRENKRGGAWMQSLSTHAASDGDSYPHVGLIAGNFTPPTSDGRPALLTHDEVTTLFHEFGHLMHLLCNTTELRGQSMEHVAWDFIELPSQILENWCWQKESLSLIAGHYETGAPLPDDLFEKMIAARNFRSATQLMRQIGFSAVDLLLHRSYDPQKDGDVVEYARDHLQKFAPLPLPEDYAMILTFTHLFASPVGYASGYYSYLWARVLDADAFTRFLQEGLLSHEVGNEFRDTILSRGDSDDPNQLFKSFMGRPATMRALLERSGLVK